MIRLGGILAPRYEDAGLTVEMPDDDLLELKDGDHVVARFTQIGATREAINDVARQYLDGCLLEEPEEAKVDCAEWRTAQAVLHLQLAGKIPFESCPRCGKPTLFHDAGKCC